MKRLFTLAIIFISTSLMSQEYNRWAGEVNWGMHAIGDESAELTDNYNHYSGTLRYNINRKVGLGVSYGKDNLSLEDFDGNVVNTDYQRFNLEMFVDIFDILDLQNNFITFIGHGGAGVSLIDANETNYYQNVMNVRGGVSALIKLSRSFALKGDFSTTVNLSQDRTLDGAYDISNAGINSTVDNLSVGLVVYFGKRNQHADWDVEEERAAVVDTFFLEPTTIDRTVTNNITQKCDCKIKEFVMFKNNSVEIGEAGVASIVKASDRMTSKSKLIIIGKASPPASEEHNMGLSERRAWEVFHKLISMGVNKDQIEVTFVGEVDTKDGKNVELSRRVDIIVE